MYLDERHTSDSTACPGDRGASGEERLPASQTWLWPDSPLGSGPQDLGGGQDQLLKHHVAPWECGHGKCGFRAHSEDRQGPGKRGGRPRGAGAGSAVKSVCPPGAVQGEWHCGWSLGTAGTGTEANARAGRRLTLSSGQEE